MSHECIENRTGIRTEIAREVVSELVNNLKNWHSTFQGSFYPFLISTITTIIVLLSYDGISSLLLVVRNRIEIAVPVYATIFILVQFQILGYRSTEIIVLASEFVGEWLQQCSIGRVKQELCEGFSLSAGANTQCLESGTEVYTTRELKLASIRCKCGSSSDEKYIKCECGYKPPGYRFQRVKLKVYLYLDIPVKKQLENIKSTQSVMHLLTLTLVSSPLRLIASFFENIVRRKLRIMMCMKCRSNKRFCRLCEKVCSGIETEEFEEISPWFELKEDLFLVLQDTLRRLEACHLYVVHAV